MLLAQTAGGVTFEVSLQDRGAAGLALPIGALAQPLEGAVDTIEDGGRSGQLRLVALLHEPAG